jgi:hypothetical protein
MKRIRLFLGFFLTALLIIGLRSFGEAFHGGGAGECQGCHSMHDMKGGQQTAQQGASSSPQKSPFLLKGPDPSSTCLACHMTPGGTGQPTGHYVCTNEADMPSGLPPSQLTPAGDFGWLKKNYVWGQGSATRGDSAGERHGHNIVANSFSFVADMRNTTAPQGVYPADQLSCISCHDPHGKYRRLAGGSITTGGLPVFASGSYNQSPDSDSLGAVGVYRMLAGKGYQPKYMSGGFAFVADPPAAVAPVSYNRGEPSVDTRVAYGQGMSEWCENCHSTSHQTNSGSARHPSGNLKKLSADVIKHYNSYIASGNNSGNGASAYTSMVPFEMGTKDYAVLKRTANNDGSDRSGPEPGKGSANVMCLSCHRAHASGWDSMTRWNMKSEFLVYKGVYPGTDNGSPPELAQGRTSSEIQKTFYGRPSNSYASYQRNLCNKCHVKD